MFSINFLTIIKLGLNSLTFFSALDILKSNRGAPHPNFGGGTKIMGHKNMVIKLLKLKSSGIRICG